MRYSWLLLDADGTLFDYNLAESQALRQTFQYAGLECRSDCIDAYREINHQLWLQFEQGLIDAERLKVLRFERLLEALQVSWDAAAFSERYLDYLALGSQLVAGAHDLVHTLKEKAELALITNGLARVQHSRLAKSTIANCFRHVIISDEVGFSKPDARIFDIAFEMMGNPIKENVLMVGDSLTSDMKGGVEYGIDTCWYNPGQESNPSGVAVRYEIQVLEQLFMIVA